MTVPSLARDIMKTELVTLSADMDLHDAAMLLVRNKISGAPVVLSLIHISEPTRPY